MKRLAVLGLLLAVTGIACTGRFPYGQSKDRHPFASTVHTPLNVHLVDNVSKETIWEMQVPVGKTAIVQIVPEYKWKSHTPRTGGPAKTFRWTVIDTGDDEPWGDDALSNELDLNGRSVRLVVKVRDSAATSDQAADAG